MTDADVRAATISADFAVKPGGDEIDLFGLTHRGKVRVSNENNFLSATIHLSWQTASVVAWPARRMGP